MKALVIAGLMLSSVMGAPMDAPELRVTRFALSQDALCVGQTGTIVVEATNVGNLEATSVAAAVTLADRETYLTNTLPLQRIAKLAPGATARFEWQITPTDTSGKLVVCRVNAFDLDGEEKSFDWQPLPKERPILADANSEIPEAYSYPEWWACDRWPPLEDFSESLLTYDWAAPESTIPPYLTDAE